MKEKLDNLNKRKGRRLLEPEGSPNRLQHVCDLFPETIDDSDTDRLGYHRQCYQKFTSNLNRLLTTLLHHLHVRIFTAPHANNHIRKHNFSPSECIFCSKKRRRMIRLKKFTSFKGKYPQWKDIEPHSLELNDMKLYRKVQGQDLWGREAQFHSTCHNAFKLRHVNLSKQSSIATTAATPSFLSLRTEAHSTTLKYHGISSETCHYWKRDSWTLFSETYVRWTLGKIWL